ncbi:hypothetical protein CVT26_000982 [Gymnopilus dilepis]|uniref:Uncharacterized protein n=1 Tax=Gymnopilus dilepis TaxID=231916 RepID=A0A409WVX6_9AGAR|nr:hypothetical protein CVT26_000982 [Gymnopilus dilepis]
MSSTHRPYLISAWRFNVHRSLLTIRVLIHFACNYNIRLVKAHRKALTQLITSSHCLASERLRISGEVPEEAKASSDIFGSVVSAEGMRRMRSTLCFFANAKQYQSVPPMKAAAIRVKNKSDPAE